MLHEVIIDGQRYVPEKPQEGGSETPAPAPAPFEVTPSVAMEIISHEAIVQEAYKDSVGNWTWSVGITNASGHTVYPRYKDNPQSLERCIEVFLWVLQNNYVPAVKAAFRSPLSESQFAAALSFHYNTGGIGRAEWVTEWNRGNAEVARSAIMNWRKPPEIIPRRKKEQALFFDGTWSSDGKATVYAVSKPSYSPKWSSAKKVDVSKIINSLLEAS